MTRARSRGDDEPLLFDPTEAAPPARPAEEMDLPLFEEAEVAAASGEAPGAAADEARPSGPAAQPEGRVAPLAPRLLAALLDALVVLAVAVSLLVGVLLMGIRPQVSDWPALVVFLTIFSFLYTVVPVAFWGQTPGMACLDLYCRGRQHRHLTFRQTVLRWLGGLLTWLGLGLPGLLALSGRSLADRMSGSRTYTGRLRLPDASARHTE